jgi:hypothetical protein
MYIHTQALAAAAAAVTWRALVELRQVSSENKATRNASAHHAPTVSREPRCFVPIYPAHHTIVTHIPKRHFNRRLQKTTLQAV